MSDMVTRAMSIVEQLARHPAGLSVGELSNVLDLPPTATHRLLKDLVESGYVQQDQAKGDYRINVRFAALGLLFLARSGITEVTQPTLDSLAQESRELVRLGLIENNSLIWVAYSQGAVGGLRYEPEHEHGVTAHPASSASGQAWLSTMSDEDALLVATATGFVPDSSAPGPNAPMTAVALLKTLAVVRREGYSMTRDSYMLGMAAVAAPIRHAIDESVVGAVAITGPSSRLTIEYMKGLAPQLLEAAKNLGNAVPVSKLFNRAQGGNLPGSVSAKNSLQRDAARKLRGAHDRVRATRSRSQG